MTTRGQINSNFYQIVNVDGDGNPTDIKPEYITNIGNLTSLTVTGNITAGNLSTSGNITASNISGNLTGNVSGNVSGDLTGNVNGNLTGTTVSVTGNITGANLNGNLYGGNISVANITANGEISSTGNVTAPFFIGNVVGNISGNLVVPGSNQAVLYNYLGNAGASDAFKFNQDNNTVTIVGPVYGDSFFGDGSGLYNITAANVTGLGNVAYLSLDGDSANILYGNGVFAPLPDTVANANYATYAGTADIANTAYSVDVANVSGIGNIATLNLDGNVSNILHGDGSWGPESGNLSANYANFAGEAFSVSGSNVSGEVANANYSTYSGTAGTANSVAVGNVSGIGNIATVNLDGNSGNILYGNGVFSAVPIVSNVANANYANFAGTAYSVSGANVSGEVANANYATYSGTAYSVSGANVSGDVSGANHANVADVANSVSGSNVSGDVSGANHANVADTANSVAVANVTGIGNIAVLNLTGSTSNVLFGNGVFAPIPTVNNVANANYANFAGQVVDATQSNITSVGTLTSLSVSGNANVGNIGATNGVFTNVSGNGSALSSITGANVTGTVANATYAVSAGSATTAVTVTANSQPNITSTGNLVNLTINNGVAGSPTKQFDPNGISIGSTANTNLMANSSFVDIDYGNGQGDGNVLLGKAQTYLKARGNASSIATANVSDRVGRTNYMFYNGTSNVLAAATQVNPFAVFNSNANAVTTAGQYQIITGNPNGDQGNANALSNQNTYGFDPYGRITITQGAAGTTGAAININTYGGAGGGAAAGTQGILWSRYRGNRDGNLSVQPNDTLGSLLFAGYNGTSLFSTRLSQISSVVDSSYVANTTAIPSGLRFTTCDNTTSYIHNFYANGNVAFSGGRTVSASYFSGDGSNLSNVGLSNSATGGQLSLNPTGAGSPFLYVNGNSAGGNTGSLTLTDSGLTVNVDGDNYPGGAPTFAFSTYKTAGSGPIPPQFYKRYAGTPISPSGVANGDQILNQYYQVYGDSGNTNMTLGTVLASVGNVYSPGNISLNYQISGNSNPNDLCTISFASIRLDGNVLLTSNKTLTYDRTYGSFQNNSTITPAAANTQYTLPVTYTNTETNNMTLGGTGNVTIQKAGVYNLQYSLQIVNGDNANDHNAYVWFAKNGTSYSNSATVFNISKNGGTTVGTVNYLVTAATNDVFTLEYEVDNTSVTFPYTASAGSRPGCPSVILTVVPVGA